MSYSTVQKITPIEMLPELEDLERGNFGGNPHQPPMHGGAYGTYPGATMLPPGDAEKFARYIRGNHVMPQEAGMVPHNQAPQSQYIKPQPSMNYYGTPIGEDEHIGKAELKTFNTSNTPSCLDVAEHVANCPICSKFYSNDKTIYIIAIVVLSIIVILLLKRILDV